MVDEVDAATDVVVIVKVALVAPAGTVTLAGTVVALELAESDTDAPPAGAAALNVTVPVEELPPATLVGLSESAESVATGGGVGGLITQCVALTSGAVIVNEALVLPAGIVTGPGVTTRPSTLPLTQTDAPPAGAGLVSVTVPVVVPPPRTLGDATVTDDRLDAAPGVPTGVNASTTCGAR